MLSRSGRASASGQKLTNEIKTRVDDDTRDELDRLSRRAGVSLSEFVRDLLMIRAFGLDHVRTLHEERWAVVAGKGPEDARE